ncbi:adenosylcobinamide-GDP ribazoletransferase [Laceyella putida]|uniref:Adenosylcobinamide-GDP ribazoletransferase n=1 Tax=Laceyella putida TaxID=110101 RepID=A0ABW2RJM3_9BACL
MSGFAHAVAFLTRLPVPRRWLKGDHRTSPMWYPMVGALLGLVLIGFDWLVARWFPQMVRAVLDVGCWVYLTGGLHLDGLMDTADGFGAYRDRERTLQIMKDSRVGAMGVLAAVLVLLLKVSTLYYLLQFHVWDGAFAWGSAVMIARFAAVVAIFAFPYVQAQGMGSGLKESLSTWRINLSSFCSILPLIWWWEWEGVVLFVVVFALTWLFGKLAVYRIGGFTGDIYGALIEGVEVAVLLFFTMGVRLG